MKADAILKDVLQQCVLNFWDSVDEVLKGSYSNELFLTVLSNLCF